MRYGTSVWNESMKAYINIKEVMLKIMYVSGILTNVWFLKMLLDSFCWKMPDVYSYKGNIYLFRAGNYKKIEKII